MKMLEAKFLRLSTEFYAALYKYNFYMYVKLITILFTNKFSNIQYQYKKWAIQPQKKIIVSKKKIIEVSMMIKDFEDMKLIISLHWLQKNMPENILLN